MCMYSCMLCVCINELVCERISLMYDVIYQWCCVLYMWIADHRYVLNVYDCIVSMYWYVLVMYQWLVMYEWLVM